MRRRDALLTLLPPLGLLSGCVTRREMPLDPTLFPHTPTAPQTRLPGTLAVLATSTVKDLVHEGLRRVLDERSPRRRAFKLRSIEAGGGGFMPEFADGDWQRIRDAIYEGRGT
jgi:hypothetical protein